MSIANVKLSARCWWYVLSHWANVKQTWLNTVTWTRENQPGSMIFFPLCFPVVFALKLYQQVTIEKLIVALNELDIVLQKILAAVPKKSEVV